MQIVTLAHFTSHILYTCFRLLLAFSALDYHSDALLAVLDVAVDARLQSMPPGQLATALWAMAKEEHVPSAAVLARAEAACIKGFMGLTPGQAAVVCLCVCLVLLFVLLFGVVVCVVAWC